MGSCLSKGKHKTKFKDENCENINDKLVIFSQASTSPCPLLPKIALSPSKSPISINSTSSLSSSISCPSSEFSLTSVVSSISSSSSASSSWSSSVLSSKERSFSNEFLRSCAKENSHIIGLLPIRESTEKPSLSKRHIHSQKFVPSPNRCVVQMKQQPERLAGYTPKKRVRSNSPVMIRQKSLRKDHERDLSSSNHLPSIALRSPSPSRRFNMESPRRVSTNANKESAHHYKRSTIFKVNNANSYDALSSVKKDLIKSPSANHDLIRRNSSFKSKDTSIQKIDAMIAESRVGELQAKKDIDSIFMEDINNPHIALDCFIFL